jgi:hypothetical protein
VNDGRAQGSPVLTKTDIRSSFSLGLTSSGTLYVYRDDKPRAIRVAPIDLEAGALRPSDPGAFEILAGSRNGRGGCRIRRVVSIPKIDDEQIGVDECHRRPGWRLRPSSTRRSGVSRDANDATRRVAARRWLAGCATRRASGSPRWAGEFEPRLARCK